MKKISLEEQKAIQLEMLKEVDAFCKENEIRYSLAYGTLLGAIRHKGYIPWDDDMDLLMPLQDMIRFKELFKSESLKYIDVDVDKTYEFQFSRIINTNTINKKGIKDGYGINIDLYPFIPVPRDQDERELFFNQARRIIKKRLLFIKWRSRLIKYLPIRSIPGFHHAIKRYRDYILGVEQYRDSGVYYIVAGPLSHQNQDTYFENLFDNMIEVDFEGCKFKAVSEYDLYLRQSYGDYMQLPPEDQRHPYHGGNYYWK